MVDHVFSVFLQHCRPPHADATCDGDLVPRVFHAHTTAAAAAAHVAYLARPWPRASRRRLRRPAAPRLPTTGEQPLDAAGWHRVRAWSDDDDDDNDVAFDSDGVFTGHVVHEVMLRHGTEPLYAALRPRVCFTRQRDAEAYVQRCHDAGPLPLCARMHAVRHDADVVQLSAQACALPAPALVVEYDDLLDVLADVCRARLSSSSSPLYELRYTVSRHTTECTHRPFARPCVFGRAHLAFDVARTLSRVSAHVAGRAVPLAGWRVMRYTDHVGTWHACHVSSHMQRLTESATTHSPSDSDSEDDDDDNMSTPSGSDSDDDDDVSGSASAHEDERTVCRSAPVSPPLRRLRRRHRFAPLNRSWPLCDACEYTE